MSVNAKAAVLGQAGSCTCDGLMSGAWIWQRNGHVKNTDPVLLKSVTKFDALDAMKVSN